MSNQRSTPRLELSVRVTDIMYSVTKRIDFCYGHRLLDYDGVCKHPHGHNAVAEIEVRTETLDKRNMVVDFTDIKQRREELDRPRARSPDDPAPRRSAGGRAAEARRAGLPAREQSHRRADRPPAVRHLPRAGAARVPRDGVGDAFVMGDLHAADRLRSRRHARSIPAATSPNPPTSSSPNSVARRCPRTRSAAWSAKGAAVLVTPRARGRRVWPTCLARCRGSSRSTTAG